MKGDRALECSHEHFWVDFPFLRLLGCEAGADHRSLAERLGAAGYSAGSRRGLALRTKQCYWAWAARYAVFAGDEREVMRVDTASRFLTSVVNDEDCAYSTQKQALNAVASFLRQVCRVEDPVFQVKLRKTGGANPGGAVEAGDGAAFRETGRAAEGGEMHGRRLRVGVAASIRSRFATVGASEIEDQRCGSRAWDLDLPLTKAIE